MKDKKISVLDCTLRDGAYIVEGKFDDAAIQGIITKLGEANLDIIECGWLKDAAYESDTSYFHSPADIRKFLKKKKEDIVYVAMIDWDRYDVSNLMDCDGTSIDAIRVVFPSTKYQEAMGICKIIKQKGYKLYLQAANTLGYTDTELIRMIQHVNEINPVGLSIVDTFGAMYENDLMRMVSIVDHNLNPNICIGLHSHNNLQQSFSLAMSFVNMLFSTDRKIIIDGSLAGMGRGAGNAPTELLVEYLNKYHAGKYNLDIVMDTIDLYMNYYLANYRWGYSIPYFLSGTYCAHVNNIAYLNKSHRTSNAAIKKILECMPADKRLVYDYDLLEETYIAQCENPLDDSDTINKLRPIADYSEVLLIAPGQSVNKEIVHIKRISQKEETLTIGINAYIDGFAYDYLFFTNEMRIAYAYETFGEVLRNIPVIITSNLTEKVMDLGLKTVYEVNYSSLMKRGWVHFDNSMIMCLRLLAKLNVKNVLIAGMDGYGRKNTYSSEMLKTDISENEIQQLNEEIQSMLDEFQTSSNMVHIQFITNSIYKARR